MRTVSFTLKAVHGRFISLFSRLFVAELSLSRLFRAADLSVILSRGFIADLSVSLSRPFIAKISVSFSRLLTAPKCSCGLLK